MAASPTDGAAQVAALIARSNRLGSDPTVTNYAGGNTSAKGDEIDPVTGSPVELLWVKGSGGDLGTLTEKGLAVLRLDRLQVNGRCVSRSRARRRHGRRLRLLLARSRWRSSFDRYRDAWSGRREPRRSSASRCGDRFRHRGGRRGSDPRVLW